MKTISNIRLEMTQYKYNTKDSKSKTGRMIKFYNDAITLLSVMGCNGVQKSKADLIEKITKIESVAQLCVSKKESKRVRDEYDFQSYVYGLKIVNYILDEND